MKPTFILTLFLVASLLVSGCTTIVSQKHPVTFADLKGWKNQELGYLKPTMLSSCEKLDEDTFTETKAWGTYKQWRLLCQELAQTPERQLKGFFEHNFTPIQLSPKQPGLFTGYYSSVIAGSLMPSEDYQVPLRTLPDDMIRVRLRDFNLAGKTLEGKTLVGQVKDGYLKPYRARKAIEQQAATGDETLLWLASAEDKFFLQIQGSGNVQLEDGSIIHVGYAGNNGRDYTSIGRILKESGELTDVSMQSIKQWLADNPDKQQWLFNQNQRYIFFKQNKEGAITAQGVPAVSGRTLAVDPSIIPLGVPVWLDTTVSATKEPFQRLMIAQDTGSAIKGSVRGDIYFGIGKAAAVLAGKQKSSGKMYFLVPRSVNVEPGTGGR